jgi:hypothetical protein
LFISSVFAVLGRQNGGKRRSGGDPETPSKRRSEAIEFEMTKEASEILVEAIELILTLNLRSLAEEIPRARLKWRRKMEGNGTDRLEGMEEVVLNFGRGFGRGQVWKFNTIRTLVLISDLGIAMRRF